MKFEPVIGLEVHAQLLTNSKIFCRCSTMFGAAPNSQVCPICLGLPGVLPVLNKRAVDFALRMGLATNCRIAPFSIFARKNYFYPDLPKGYQVSQYEKPLCENGSLSLEIDGNERTLRIKRIHLEEDAGKSIHAEQFVDADETLVDVNRCGVPLIEIVGEPDIRSPREAYYYLRHLRQLVQYLEICDGNMEEGSFRCDANVSVRPAGTAPLGVKTELKNLNSFRAVEKALEFEIDRQVAILESGGRIHQETLSWDADRNEATLMRSKEFADDYRYFPEPDLVPLAVDNRWITAVEAGLPELPLARRNRFVANYGITVTDAEILTETSALADYFDALAQASQDAKAASNWVKGEVLRVLKELQISITEFPVQAKDLAELIQLTQAGKISGKIAKSVFQEMVSTGKKAAKIVEQQGLGQISDQDAVGEVVRKVVAANPDEVQKYLDGKEQVIGFLVGQVMRETRGQANPKLANELLRSELDRRRPS